MHFTSSWTYLNEGDIACVILYETNIENKGKTASNNTLRSKWVHVHGAFLGFQFLFSLLQEHKDGKQVILACLKPEFRFN